MVFARVRSCPRLSGESHRESPEVGRRGHKERRFPAGDRTARQKAAPTRATRSAFDRASDRSRQDFVLEVLEIRFLVFAIERFLKFLDFKNPKFEIAKISRNKAMKQGGAIRGLNRAVFCHSYNIEAAQRASPGERLDLGAKMRYA
jgi:hypothetical protein